MPKVKSFQLILIAMIILALSSYIGQASVKKKDNTSIKGPDVITIELSAEFSDDEMPPVDFLHTLHSQTDDGKCDRCHNKKDDNFVFKFKRTGEPPSIELYHDNCIACHVDLKNSGKKAGPQEAECRNCHGAVRQMESSWEKIDFDKSLHFIHETSKEIKPAISSESDNCSACHHKYNTKTKQIYYTRGQEESCIYCHKDKEKESVRSLRNASHDTCVACHTGMKTRKITAGPVTCIECHDETQQSKIKKVKNITRLKRNQPDAALITGRISKEEPPQYLTIPVAFNHKLHELKTDSCISCHHESLKKCTECHTSQGDKSGQFITLSQAMHDRKSKQSCMGCHEEFTEKNDCAGCHDLMPQKQLKDSSCETCHNTEAGMVSANKDTQKIIAEQTIAKLSGNYQNVMKAKIPEKVMIDGLTDEFKPSSFPHRKVVQAIANRVEKSSMAKSFHMDQQTLCMGCHHNSPKSLEPPKCGSCHGKKTDIINSKPSLKGAYHGQCITCHQKMEVKSVMPTDCNKCHEKK